MATGTGNAQGQKNDSTKQGDAKGGAGKAPHTLPPLPYAIDALQPHMSAETLQFHHGKHHKTYVDKLNELIAGTEHADKSLEESGAVYTFSLGR